MNMKKSSCSLWIIALFVALVAPFKTVAQETPQKLFSFAFFTDIHLSKNPNRCFEGLNKAIATAKSLNVDFILSGGDNMNIDVLKSDSTTAHELYQYFKGVVENSGIKIYPAVGNHDRFFGSWKESPMTDEGMFESYFGKSYYSFTHKGWHFITLNSLQQNETVSYPGISEKQLQWLNSDLEAPENAGLPTVVVTHVPIVSTSWINEGKPRIGDLVSNGKIVWDTLRKGNLKLVLQGHKHVYEEILTAGTQLIGGGAICAAWWGGTFNEGTEEGFVVVDVYSDNSYRWHYVDYGWDVEKK